MSAYLQRATFLLLAAVFAILIADHLTAANPPLCPAVPNPVEEPATLRSLKP